MLVRPQDPATTRHHFHARGRYTFASCQDGDSRLVTPFAVNHPFCDATCLKLVGSAALCARIAWMHGKLGASMAHAAALAEVGSELMCCAVLQGGDALLRGLPGAVMQHVAARPVGLRPHHRPAAGARHVQMLHAVHFRVYMHRLAAQRRMRLHIFCYDTVLTLCGYACLQGATTTITEANTESLLYCYALGFGASRLTVYIRNSRACALRASVTASALLAAQITTSRLS